MAIAQDYMARIKIAVGVDYPLRVNFTLAGALVDPADLAGFAPVNTLVDVVFGNFPLPAGATAFDMIAYPLVYANPNIGANNVWKIRDKASTPITGAYIINLAALPVGPFIGFAPDTTACGRNGHIRIYSSVAAFDNIFIDFSVQRYSESQFQNLMLGSQQVDTATNQLVMYPMSALGGGNNVAFDLKDALGNASSVQPASRTFNASTGVIPE